MFTTSRRGWSPHPHRKRPRAMSIETGIAIVTFLFGIGGPVGVYVLLRKEMRQAPIEYQTAQVADAVAVSSAARGLVDTVNSRLEVQDEKVDRITRENERLRHREGKWWFWYDDLGDDWDTHREGPNPPPPPVTRGSE